jgi:hypothetical protein
MTEAEARARIILFAAAAEEPVLDSANVDVLLSMAKRVDENGIEPGAANWTPTWSVNYAVAQGWLAKSGRLSGHYLFMSGGKMFARQQMYDHCMKLYMKYATKAGIQSVRLGPDEELAETVPLLGNWNANSD